MTAMTYTDRVAAWAVVFPHAIRGYPNVEAEWLTSLEAMLEELRETGRPIPKAARRDVRKHVWELLDVLGKLETE
jgi:hypothetical protein